jgi:hypothetical protein
MEAMRVSRSRCARPVGVAGGAAAAAIAARRTGAGGQRGPPGGAGDLGSAREPPTAAGLVAGCRGAGRPEIACGRRGG